jgi:NADH-quinone oxidoreductase subunit H
MFSFLNFIPPVMWLELKTVFICFIFVLVRATLPRYRYDQLMDIC